MCEWDLIIWVHFPNRFIVSSDPPHPTFCQWQGLSGLLSAYEGLCYEIGVLSLCVTPMFYLYFFMHQLVLLRSS